MIRPATLALLLAVPVAAAAGAQPGQAELKRLSLEELMAVDVTLTSRQPEPVGMTAAAVSIVSAEDIRRSGVTTIPDALALATGVHVSRFNNGSWSISTRGFNATTANKLLVMIDGRTVYSPLFSGVFWNTIDYTLEDIERIEVVRGPGATLWGANAFNGVVNIVTRHSADTQGTFAQIGGGNEDPLLAEARYGGTRGATTYRVYGKFAVRASQVFTDGSSTGDRRQRGQVGFRLDRGGDGGSLLLKGDLFYSTNDFPDRPDGSFLFGNVQGRWTRRLSDRADVQVQTYLNHEHRVVPEQLSHRLTTFDVDTQQTYTTPRHALVWGGGLRINHDTTEGSRVLAFAPAARTYPVVNGFIQDQVAVVPDALFVTGGVKVEHNTFSGGEVQPGVRVRWLLPRGQTLWGSLARAVRRPTRFESDVRASAPNGLLLARGNPEFQAERLIATEAGYRVRPTPMVALDIVAFHHAIDRLRSQDAPPGVPPFPVVVGNTLNGQASGVEVSVTLQPRDWWRADLSYTGQDVTITRDAGSRDVGRGVSEANDPAHQVAFRNSLDLPGGVEFDVRWRRVAALPAPIVPAYAELGLRLGWQAAPRVSLALVGEDLLHDHHAEFNPTVRGYEEFERSVRAVVTVRSR
ncbi:MAG: TonB-dependent receptor plug domain-containing protein [Vicinamibacterales bacterium]